MEATGVGAVAVVEGDALVGIVTDRDLAVRALGRRCDGSRVVTRRRLGRQDAPVPGTTA